MALVTNNLYGTTTRGPLPRLQPREGPGAVMVQTFKTGTAATLPIGCPLYKEAASGFVVKLIPGSATAEQTQIWGFVFGAEVTINASTEVLGTVMCKGSAHYDDLLALQTAGTLAGTTQQLKDACRAQILSTRDIHIEGLSLIGGTTGL